MNKQEIIENLAAAIENMIDAKSAQVKTDLIQNKLYQSRTDVKECLALLLDVEMN
jgi:hypothetical protein